MKSILLLSILLTLTSCVTPVVSTYTNPPGVFVGLPLVPVEAGIQMRGAARMLAAQQPKQEAAPKVGLRAALSR